MAKKKKSKKKTSRRNAKGFPTASIMNPLVAPVKPAEAPPAIAGKIVPKSPPLPNAQQDDAPDVQRSDGSKATYTDALKAVLGPFNAADFKINPMVWEGVKASATLLMHGCKVLDAMVEEEEGNAKA